MALPRLWTFVCVFLAAGCASQAAPPLRPPAPQAPRPAAETWLPKLRGLPDVPLALAVFKHKRELLVVRNGVPQQSFTIRLGPHAQGRKLWRGDNRTPEGIYRICQIKPSRFKTFMWLSYPNEADARSALQAGQISFSEYERIVDALRQGDCPPPDTELGGLVGIHGDDEEPPRLYDWTEGCIAVPHDSELERLVAIVRPGTPVVIFP
jgi:hypothetical protein